MLFNSLSCLYFFRPVTYCVFWRLTSNNQRYIWLAFTGYVFYSFWNYKFCVLMAASTLVSYLAGLGFLENPDARRKKRLLVLPIVFDLAMLGVFKYANFTLASARSLAETLHLSFHPPVLDIILPVGISFYTFHTITYIVDSYRGALIRP